jgi:hypothetical protein
MNKQIEVIKALVNTPLFRKNATQVLMVAIAAVTGAFIASKIETTEVVEPINEQEIK